VPEVSDGPDQLNDQAIVLETIESMLKMRIVSEEMRRQLEDLRERVENFRPAADDEA
jgi:hypothetical protein